MTLMSAIAIYVLFVILVVVAGVSSYNLALERWARECGLRIMSKKWQFFSFTTRNPFSRGFRLMHGPICRLTVEDTRGKTRSGWVRVVQKPFFRHEVDAVWDN